MSNDCLEILAADDFDPSEEVMLTNTCCAETGYELWHVGEGFLEIRCRSCAKAIFGFFLLDRQATLDRAEDTQ